MVKLFERREIQKVVSDYEKNCGISKKGIMLFQRNIGDRKKGENYQQDIKLLIRYLDKDHKDYSDSRQDSDFDLQDLEIIALALTQKTKKNKASGNAFEKLIQYLKRRIGIHLWVLLTNMQAQADLSPERLQQILKHRREIRQYLLFLDLSISFFLCDTWSKVEYKCKESLYIDLSWNTIKPIFSKDLGSLLQQIKPTENDIKFIVSYHQKRLEKYKIDQKIKARESVLTEADIDRVITFIKDNMSCAQDVWIALHTPVNCLDSKTKTEPARLIHDRVTRELILNNPSASQQLALAMPMLSQAGLYPPLDTSDEVRQRILSLIKNYPDLADKLAVIFQLKVSQSVVFRSRKIGENSRLMEKLETAISDAIDEHQCILNIYENLMGLYDLKALTAGNIERAIIQWVSFDSTLVAKAIDDGICASTIELHMQRNHSEGSDDTNYSIEMTGGALYQHNNN